MTRSGERAPLTREPWSWWARGFVGLALMAAASCSDPAAAVPDPIPPRVELSVSPDTQGVLGRARVRAVVLDETREPLAGWIVEWRVRLEGALLGTWSDRAPAEESPAAGAGIATVAGEDGVARADWRLGGVVGTQTVEAWVPGSDTVEVDVTAVPGAVFVGRWRQDLVDTEGFPSDTMRIHVADLLYIEEALGWLADGISVRIAGPIRPGPGLDKAWPFHLDPTFARSTGASGSAECTSTPPARREEAEALQGTPFVRLCPWVLDLIGVEEVPQWYLDELQSSGL